jgi:hypothetical protein
MKTIRPCLLSFCQFWATAGEIDETRVGASYRTFSAPFLATTIFPKFFSPHHSAICRQLGEEFSFQISSRGVDLEPLATAAAEAAFA